MDKILQQIETTGTLSVGIYSVGMIIPGHLSVKDPYVDVTLTVLPGYCTVACSIWSHEAQGKAQLSASSLQRFGNPSNKRDQRLECNGEWFPSDVPEDSERGVRTWHVNKSNADSHFAHSVLQSTLECKQGVSF